MSRIYKNIKFVEIQKKIFSTFSKNRANNYIFRANRNVEFSAFLYMFLLISRM